MTPPSNRHRHNSTVHAGLIEVVMKGELINYSALALGEATE